MSLLIFSYPGTCFMSLPAMRSDLPRISHPHIASQKWRGEGGQVRGVNKSDFQKEKSRVEESCVVSGVRAAN